MISNIHFFPYKCKFIMIISYFCLEKVYKNVYINNWCKNTNDSNNITAHNQKQQNILITYMYGKNQST